MREHSVPKIGSKELERRLIFAMLRPAVMLALKFGMSLHELREWLDMAVLYEAKDSTKTLADLATQLDVSRRTVSVLHNKLKVNFFAFEQREELTRRLEFMLWSGSMTQGRIYQSMPNVDREQIDEALALLVEQKRLIREGIRTITYSVPGREFRLYQDHWLARLDGLNNHLQNVANTAFARFFFKDHRAFERTLNFRIRPEHIDKITAFYEDVLFPFLANLDDKARDIDDAQMLDLSINWAPAAFIQDVIYPQQDNDA